MTDFNRTGIRLKTARKAAGFKSAKEFCDKFGIPSSTYSLHETNHRNLKPKIAKKYADILGVNTAWLLTGSGSPYNIKTQDEPLTDNEFIELLEYKGSNKITSSFNIERLNDVNVIVFCKIIIRMVETLNELNFQLELTQISKKSVEIYKDISLSSESQEDQITMIDLSITTFKRQVLELINDDQKTL